MGMMDCRRVLLCSGCFTDPPSVTTSASSTSDGTSSSTTAESADPASSAGSATDADTSSSGTPDLESTSSSSTTGTDESSSSTGGTEVLFDLYEELCTALATEEAQSDGTTGTLSMGLSDVIFGPGDDVVFLVRSDEFAEGQAVALLSARVIAET